jgi:LysR family transcriptional regulator, glycine cleavage system transcriptional activator
VASMRESSSVRRNLPPLRALQAFDATARWLTVTRAADELFVTPGAVSQQLKALEAWFEVPLFRRDGRRLALTEAGHQLLPRVRAGFDELARATDGLVAHRSRPALRVTAPPSLAAKWLLPRLSRFRAAWPQTDLDISITSRVLDFQADDVHVAIRCCQGSRSGLWAVPLLTYELMPVCSPGLLAHIPLHVPADLRLHTLLHDKTLRACEDWGRWLELAGAHDVDSSGGIRFNHSAHAYQAAIEGCGIVLAKSALVSDDLAAGRLVRPFLLSIPASHCYQVLCPHTVASEPNVTAFYDWLRSERDRAPQHLAAETMQGEPVQCDRLARDVWLASTHP